MRLDIRLPLGFLFVILGLMLMIFGLTSDPSIYHRSLGININVIAGVGQFAFGVAGVYWGGRAEVRKLRAKGHHGKDT
jgi:hypothetical protein